jgi:hypothetical protein
MKVALIALVSILGVKNIVYVPKMNKAWGNFQEHVTSCYIEDAGVVLVDGGVQFVISNQRGSLFSNHLIAQRRLTQFGTSGTSVYTLKFYIDANTGNWLTYPEDGPEFSVQNTRYVSSQYQTATAGFQYAANPWGSPHWNVWTQSSPLSGSWASTTGPTMLIGEWYSAEVVADYNTNTYKSAKVCLADGGSCSFLGVDGGQLGVNIKWGEEGYWVTQEAENLWQSACGGGGAQALTTTVRYKDTSLISR